MQRLSGVLVVLAGAALGAYVILPAQQTSGGDRTQATLFSSVFGGENQTEIAKTQANSAQAVTIARPSTSIVPSVVPATTAERSLRVFSPAAPLSPPVATAPTGATTWTTVVSSEPASQGRLKSSKPGDAETRAVLASDLQRELKRVGCYAGEITGTWTPSTKRAMSAFMERVNATLPVEEPDYILLTLVQGHTANACGTECPSGQVQAQEGRCVPRAVVAQAARKTQRDEERRAAEDRLAQQQERLALEQRASETKRLADSRYAANAARVAAATEQSATAPKIVHVKPQQTAAAEAERLPWLTTSRPSGVAMTASSQLAARAEPMPGMMSIGGPRQETIQRPASAAIVTPDRGPGPAVKAYGDTDVAAIAAPSGDDFEQEIVPPAPTPAKRPVASTGASRPEAPNAAAGSPVAGLPGTKSGPAVGHAVTQSAAENYPYAKAARRPPPSAISSGQKSKSYAYASGSSGKARRGQPRPGSPHYNLMLTLGGIY